MKVQQLWGGEKKRGVKTPQAISIIKD